MRFSLLIVLFATFPLALQSQALHKSIDYTMEYSSMGGTLHRPATLRQLFESGNLAVANPDSEVPMTTVVTKRSYTAPYWNYLLTSSSGKTPAIQTTLKFLAQPDDESALLVYIKIKVLTNGQTQEMKDDGTQESQARMAGFFLGIANAGLLNVAKVNAMLDEGE